MDLNLSTILPMSKGERDSEYGYENTVFFCGASLTIRFWLTFPLAHQGLATSKKHLEKNALQA